MTIRGLSNLLLSLVFFCFSTFNTAIYAQNLKSETNLVTLLHQLSKDYNVYFNYNPEDLKDLSLNTSGLEGVSLKKKLKQIEHLTELKIESLGSRYYVIYSSKDLNKSNNKIKGGLLTHQNKLKLQNKVIGKITDLNGLPLAGVNIRIKGTTIGTTSNFDGNYNLDANPNDMLVYSYIGFKTKERKADKNVINVVLIEGISLNEVVMIGNRSKPRTVINSAVPIDNISAVDLSSTGQSTLDQMLNYKIPSFNSTNQAISDATAHFDPADLRGLGPSRTLVLINGKRKNQSALVYINDTPGKGEVGVDLKSIPAAAIERVEVLRDGASAQYGSDAIAGVLNIVLKKNKQYTQIETQTGITTRGDGFSNGVSINSGIPFQNSDGYLNLTAAFYQQDFTSRTNNLGFDALYNITENDTEWANWLQKYPDLGMTVGQPKTKNYNLNYNFELPVSPTCSWYSFGGLSYRIGESFALYRAPYWIEDPNNLFHEQNEVYEGFQPTFETDIRDNYFTLGFKCQILGFKTDISGTQGRNAVDYLVANSLNQSLGSNSPTRFDVGSYAFDHILTNMDFTKAFGKTNINFGWEVRRERFRSTAGEPASYLGEGTVSFPGIQPRDQLIATRNNFGSYAEVDHEFSKRFMLGTAIRYEYFSDFGKNISWKASSRYTFKEDKGALRASVSTGFRAPSLHQIYLSNTQTLVSGESVSNQGTFSNQDPIIRDNLGVKQLTAERSRNITAGITIKPLENLFFSADFYNVYVKNRVLFTNEIGFDEDFAQINPVESILIANNITSLKFFINAVNTNTNGLDLVGNYTNIKLGEAWGKLTLAANFNKTRIVDDIAAPTILKNNNYEIFNRKEQARILSARPRTKVLLGFNYNLRRLNLGLNNTFFGSVKWQHAEDPGKDQTFTGKILTDITLNYQLNTNISFYCAVNNIFNVYPDELDNKGDVLTDLGGRFKYAWEVNQFGFNGTTLNGGLRIKL